ncbi:MAG: zinc dependent phospholipase C family protein [Clostridiales bacterium]|nr:zinc dependent phospholipase C family protein [Clostridiales bacterium]
MPDLITHCICAEDGVMLLDSNDVKEEVLKRKNFLYLGAQGPDFFFYHRPFPWNEKSQIKHIGSLLHTQKTGKFIVDCLDIIKKNSYEKDEYYNMIAFIYGYISHYALDTIGHPFIFYFSGVHNINNPETVKYGVFHKKLEIIIDILVIKERRSISMDKVKAFEFISLAKESPIAVGRLMSEAIMNIHGQEVASKDILCAYKDMQSSIRFLYDPLGIKTKMIGILEIFLDKKGDYTKAIYPNKINEKIDYLNKLNKTWNHPCDYVSKTTDSFFDILDKSVDRTKYLLEYAYKYIHNQITYEEAISILEDLNYTTGYLCSIDQEMTSFDCIFEENI